jgi:hypothetical protein
MRRKPIASSVIVSLGYDEAAHILEVEFLSRRVYRFFKVPPLEYVTLLTAPSAGRYFNKVIRRKYKGVRVEE